MHMPHLIAKHPLLCGGAAVVALVLVLHGRSSSSSQSTQTAVVSTAMDPTAAALANSQMQTNAALAGAQINAQTQTAGIQAAQTVALGNQASQVQEAGIAGNVANTQTLASMFSTAVSGLLAADSMSGSGAGAIPGAGQLYNGGIMGSGSFTLNPSQSSALGLDPHSHIQIPVYTANGQGGNPTDATSNQIEELFNNVIRASQGTGPLQTVTMQNGGSGVTQTGSALVDPVFAVWDGSSAVPTITDVTINSQSQYGYTGSVFDPKTMQSARNITPNAIPAPPAPAATTLPNFSIPGLGFL